MQKQTEAFECTSIWHESEPVLVGNGPNEVVVVVFHVCTVHYWASVYKWYCHGSADCGGEVGQNTTSQRMVVGRPRVRLCVKWTSVLE